MVKTLNKLKDKKNPQITHTNETEQHADSSESVLQVK